MSDNILLADSYGSDSLKHIKYNISDETGMTVFRYNQNTFPPTSESLGAFIYPVLKIGVITGGSADWKFKGVTYHVKRGDIVILRSNVTRSIEKIYPGEDLTCDMYEFLPAFIQYSIDHLGIFYVDSDGKNDVIHYDETISKPVLALFENIKKEIKNPCPMCAEFIRGQLLSVLVLLCRITGILPSEIKNSISVTCTSTDPVYDYDNNGTKKPTVSLNHAFNVSYISNYIKDNISGEINIDDLAKTVHMSRSHFFKIFHQYNGVSVNEYILRCRISNTVRLLLDMDCNILDAAYQSGFTSSSGFYKAFRKITGCTPKEYLHSVRKDTQISYFSGGDFIYENKQ